VNRIAMSQAAAALLRALVARSGVDRERILLIGLETVDWQSLTFNGERHEISLRVAGPGSRAIADRICDGLEDAEFTIRGVIVADIGRAGEIEQAPDGSALLTIEALTVRED
jgi:hypothetical protein